MEYSDIYDSHRLLLLFFAPKYDISVKNYLKKVTTSFFPKYTKIANSTLINMLKFQWTLKSANTLVYKPLFQGINWKEGGD